jgi:hypothetical protein
MVPLGKLRGRNFPESNEATRLICVHFTPENFGAAAGLFLCVLCVSVVKSSVT